MTLRGMFARPQAEFVFVHRGRHTLGVVIYIPTRVVRVISASGSPTSGGSGRPLSNLDLIVSHIDLKFPFESISSKTPGAKVR